MFIVTWAAISVLPPPHIARRFRDPLFYHFPLLRDIAQYIGHRILGRDRLSLVRHTESVSSFSVHLVSGRFLFYIIILQRYLLGR